MKSISKITLSRMEKRGLNKISYKFNENIFEDVAKKILKLKKGIVFLTTGFYCFGTHETDGPIGTLCLSIALKKLGFRPIILTESFSKNIYEKDDIEVIYIDQNMTPDYYKKIITNYSPVALISIERPGRNFDRKYTNLNKKDITEFVCNLDELFLIDSAPYTLAIGDGGNEIGMGSIKTEIDKHLEISPSIIKSDDLIVSTVSNWGAYGVISALEIHSKIQLLPKFKDVKKILNHINKKGLVDGITGKKGTVDDLSMKTEKEILKLLENHIKSFHLNKI